MDERYRDHLATIYNMTATVALSNSLVQGAGASGSGVWIDSPQFKDGGGNIDKNPFFIDPVSPVSAPTTDGNLRLGDGSPAIETGIISILRIPVFRLTWMEKNASRITMEMGMRLLIWGHTKPADISI